MCSCVFDCTNTRWKLPRTDSVVQFVGTCKGRHTQSAIPSLWVGLDELNSELGLTVSHTTETRCSKKRKFSESSTNEYVKI